MNTESKLTGSLHLHIRGPVTATVAHLADTPAKPYAVLYLGAGETSAVLFPDAAALDSLISAATRVRDEITARTRRAEERVIRADDDSPCPVSAVVVRDAADPEYVWVRWDRPGDTPGPVVREARDELSPVRK